MTPPSRAAQRKDGISDQLNPVQQEAVRHDKGPLLILAGAGSGKTRVLTHRIAYLIHERRVPPYHILAVTFTNKAAGEMKERVEKLIGGLSTTMWIGTFHSVCARILRSEAQHIGHTQHFTVYDADDQRSLIKLTTREMGLSDRDYPPRMVQARISRAKNALISPAEFTDQATTFRDQRIAEIYQRYQAGLRASNALDFDDLLTCPIELFEKYPPILEAYQARFQYILIDEYQDTNHAQYVLVNKLAAQHRNLCVVGDDDQSIYAFRGADIRNILDFERDYPDAKVVRLERNYRSTQIILQAANAVVQNNEGRKHKELWTNNDKGTKLGMLECLNEGDEASRIVEIIRSEQRSLKDFVILYRTNAQSRALEDALRRAGLPYVIVGGLRFYERKEIKDVLAYLRVISNPSDSVSLRRIINIPRRGVGNKTMQLLEDFAVQQGISLFEAVEAADQLEIASATTKELRAFAEFIRIFADHKGDIAVAELTQELLNQIGYFDVLAKEGRVEAEVRRENVKELVSAMADFADEVEDPSLDAFLEKVSLITDVDQWSDENDTVTLMTLHCAKGLEFPVVFIAGLEDGLFPIAGAMEKQEDLEEERRLFYVGITRAKEDLLFSYAFQRRQYGTTTSAKRSMFLEEIPKELLDYQAVRRTFGDRQRAASDTTERVIDYSFYDDIAMDELPFKVGNWVIHPKWGRGQILEKSGVGEHTRFLIAFENGQKKKVVAKYAHLDVG